MLIESLRNRAILLTLVLFGIFAFALFVVNSKTTWIANAICYECQQETWDAFEGDPGYTGGRQTSWGEKYYQTTPCGGSSCKTEWCDCGEFGCCGSCGGSCTDKKCHENIVADSFCPAGNNAQCISHTIPSAVDVGQSYNVSVTMKNTGINTWTRADDYKLGRADDIWGTTRDLLSGGDSVATDQQHTFSFSITAPSTQGSYNGQWQMVEEFVQWFGDSCGPSVITINNNDPTASITGPTTAETGDTLTYDGEDINDPEGNIDLARIWVKVAGSTAPWPSSYSCPNTPSNQWCLLEEDTTVSSGKMTANWTPSDPDTYNVHIMAADENGGQCSGNPECTMNGGSDSCTGWGDCGSSDNFNVTVTSSEPTLNSLEVTETVNNQSSGFEGNLGYSGNIASDQGSNWINSMDIKVNATEATSGELFDEFYVAFYAGDKETSGSSFLSSVQGILNSDRKDGFLLRHSSAGYQVWDSCAADWGLVDPDTGFQIQENCSGGETLYSVSLVGKTDTSVTWGVTFNKNFGSKSMNTAAYVKDAGNQTAFSPDCTAWVDTSSEQDKTDQRCTQLE